MQGPQLDQLPKVVGWSQVDTFALSLYHRMFCPGTAEVQRGGKSHHLPTALWKTTTKLHPLFVCALDCDF